MGVREYFHIISEKKYWKKRKSGFGGSKKIIAEAHPYFLYSYKKRYALQEIYFSTNDLSPVERVWRGFW